jgi:carboxynorspermidine decarboxylase
MKTPYYLIDESRLLVNLQKIDYLRKRSGAKVLLATKCFSTWKAFPLMQEYMDGTTSSSLYETRLGYEHFGGETHSYCVAYKNEDIVGVHGYADTIIFNSISQLERYYPEVKDKRIGLRINPGVSYSHYDLADPNRVYSRLGVTSTHQDLLDVLPKISGVMFHFNCDNVDYHNFSKHLKQIERTYGYLLNKLAWVSLGGGVLFTNKGYPLKAFAKRLKEFSDKHQVQVYLEPGEAVITGVCDLVTSVVDVVYNREHIAIVDASVEPHMLDLLIYRLPAVMSSSGKYTYIVSGRSCLAGDVFGKCNFKKPLQIGDEIRIQNAGGYSIVKNTWFNGLDLPSIVIKRLDGEIEITRQLSYKHFKNNLS